MPSWHGIFQFGSFLSIALIGSRCISALTPSSHPCNFFMFFLSTQPFCYVLSIPIFYGKIILFPLLVCPHAFSTYLLVEFSFVILGCQVLFVLLDHVYFV